MATVRELVVLLVVLAALQPSWAMQGSGIVVAGLASTYGACSAGWACVEQHPCRTTLNVDATPTPSQLQDGYL